MEGITILNEFAVNEGSVGWLAIIAGVILCLLCLWAMFFAFYEDDFGFAALFMVFALVCAGLIAFGTCAVMTPPETRYQVLIDESVSMSEFFEKYEIIEQEGKIYTVKEKEK